jgi:hypothetical protein
MVITAPLDGFCGVVKSDVVVEDAAHAAGPASNARELNSTGIKRRRDTCLEVIVRFNESMAEWFMGVKAPISAVGSFTFRSGTVTGS